MGVKILDILEKKEISINDLQGKTIAVDASNHIFQFLSTIRSRDGQLLTDSHGNVTSHLTGIFSRTANLMQKGIKLAYVFDGKPPKLKFTEQKRRRELKIEAEKKLAEATEKADIDAMRKYASRTSRLTPEMVEETKKLLDAMGIPVIQAPSEGEAQASFLTKKGDAFAVSSQDGDCLLFGAKKLVRNLSITGKKKNPGKLGYQTVSPEMVVLEEDLKNLGITQDQLIVAGILTGTDFNYGGIKGIGSKNALKLVREHGKNFEELFAQVKWKNYFEYDWNDVFEIFKEADVTEKYTLEWKIPDKEKIIKLLVKEHDFSEERIVKTSSEITAFYEKNSQRGLKKWF